LFEEPTVENLALLISQSQNGQRDGPINRTCEESADQLLKQLDQLSNEQVDALLHEALAEEEIRK
jgi:hypothetical protein